LAVRRSLLRELLQLVMERQDVLSISHCRILVPRCPGVKDLPLTVLMPPWLLNPRAFKAAEINPKQFGPAIAEFALV